ncbi:ornithine decarboxylase [Saccharopolyspora erythraea NRRL 2338]|uniref:ornithine decarboxylase n=2 Tax=Saccharopolyspora erythraea TaxID=1836 RepID=A4FHS8_SACEN|nr:type III PLP-dependent enzyme [Saccharopolyspora erythraea]EQD82228.1 ornithine decarboxylase [Saccharopolyspora erythraea D]PFG97290.1 ornithine decarboxylase [Saccharopolyspora erythraea NRRL 2338]QRK87482.1 type III PLP-dependent enzyme [Saccharopolyspora erythraea]CAM03603.1 ornithine decarboxylase [Saccharopolyspora erythraea NRRL 2338]
MIDDLLAADPAAEPIEAVHRRLRGFLDRHRPPTPCLVVDLPTIAHRYRRLRGLFPRAVVHYAVKANPAPEVVSLLAGLGASFDVASPAEAELCLRAGAAPDRLSYGNTVKKASDVARVHGLGVRMFTVDSEPDLVNVSAEAPGADVLCRVFAEPPGASTPFGRKFGCEPELAESLLRRAGRLGLRPRGVSFHVGTQQLDPRAWEHGIATAARLMDRLADSGVRLTTLDLGGGFPAAYRDGAPPPSEYAAAIEEYLDRYFGAARPEVVLEPGRAVVADAGVLRSEVVLVSRKAYEHRHRWVYLDVGRHNGLTETEDEFITYALATPHDGGPTGPVVLAGPTCDGDDVLYERNTYHLPLDLHAGDHVDVLAAGAYTASCATVGFNGFPPLPTIHLGLDGEPVTGVAHHG